jgi:glyoxylase-like metal-dependent hydrolase (beta-lactamase superfamily II)
MSRVISFVFNPFQENTYLIVDDSKECIIIDPGCYTASEQAELTGYIEENGLKPVGLLNTHCHVDHVVGNKFISDKYNLGLIMHKDDLKILKDAPDHARLFGISIEPSPDPVRFLEDGETYSFGNTHLKILHTPGHSPGSISLYNEKDGYVIVGDVIFFQSVGRTDLPGGSMDVLISSIMNRILSLGEETRIYSGHGPQTNVGFEKNNNPFLQ